jgi:hypothetical protein
MVGEPPSCLLEGVGEGGEGLAKFTVVWLWSILGRHCTTVELIEHILPPLGSVVRLDLPAYGVETHLPVGLVGVVAVDTVAVQKRVEGFTRNQRRGRLFGWGSPGGRTGECEAARDDENTGGDHGDGGRQSTGLGAFGNLNDTMRQQQIAEGWPACTHIG